MKEHETTLGSLFTLSRTDSPLQVLQVGSPSSQKQVSWAHFQDRPRDAVQVASLFCRASMVPFCLQRRISPSEKAFMIWLPYALWPTEVLAPHSSASIPSWALPSPSISPNLTCPSRPNSNDGFFANLFLMTLFCKWGNRGSAELNNLPKSTQLANDEIQISSQAC